MHSESESENMELFDRNIEPNCEYCSNSINKSENLICSVNCHIDENGQCSRFCYNPLMRIPKNFPKLMDYELEDFKL